MIRERIDVETCPDLLQVALHRNRYNFCLERLSSQDSVLEIGAGLGGLTKLLLSRCGSYVGIEYDRLSCVEARRKTGGKAEILEGDARNLPFEADRFSLIICLEVLEHLDDFRAGVDEIHRCLQPSGTAIVSVPFRKRGGKSSSNVHHLYEPGERELTSLMKRLFRNVEVYYQYFEESIFMSLARKLHLRRLLGLDAIYADLTAGASRATNHLRIGQRRRGLTEGLIVVATGKK